MYLLTLKHRQDDGAYAVLNRYGEKVLFMFEEEDDAERYAMMLNDDEDTDSLEVTTNSAITCRTGKLTLSCRDLKFECMSLATLKCFFIKVSKFVTARKNFFLQFF